MMMERQVARWMGAVLYRTDFRPVSLKETYIVGDKVCISSLPDMFPSSLLLIS
jgi:hypothetical protein